jgi:hypothetical protein
MFGCRLWSLGRYGGRHVWCGLGAGVLHFLIVSVFGQFSIKTVHSLLLSLLFKKKECVPYFTSLVPFGRFVAHQFDGFVAHRCSRPLLHGPGPISSGTRSSLLPSEYILFLDQKPCFSCDCRRRDGGNRATVKKLN